MAHMHKPYASSSTDFLSANEIRDCPILLWVVAIACIRVCGVCMYMSAQPNMEMMIVYAVMINTPTQTFSI